GFSPSVHHQTFTSPAAQGDLTTLPDIALPMGHYPSSVKELIMAQAKFPQSISFDIGHWTFRIRHSPTPKHTPTHG
ncbi:MAG TPA: hypothetical protein VK589_26055, partial [Chryseolinea sp.]|nr:hypothetical protein [Chryseolinea sp.]